MNDRESINRYLREHGLTTLDDPGSLMMQLGTLVEDHDHFQRLLARCAPEERRNMYESVRPHLRFRPAPLDVYIADAGAIAEREQQMTVDEEGKFHAFHVPQIIAIESLE